MSVENLGGTESHRIMEVRLTRPPLPVRVASKLLRQARWLYWRARLAAFGAGSAINPPAFVYGARSIWIGRSVRIWRCARIEALCDTPGRKCITIDDGTVIQPYAHIGAVDSVSIGRGVVIASGVYITDHDHDYSDPDDPPISNRRVAVAPVQIGDYAWLGERVMVLKGVEIGERSVIGAGSIVTRSIPSYSLAVGVPARVIRKYDRSVGAWVSTVAGAAPQHGLQTANGVDK